MRPQQTYLRCLANRGCVALRPPSLGAVRSVSREFGVAARWGDVFTTPPPWAGIRLRFVTADELPCFCTGTMMWSFCHRGDSCKAKMAAFLATSGRKSLAGPGRAGPGRPAAAAKAEYQNMPQISQLSMGNCNKKADILIHAASPHAAANRPLKMAVLNGDCVHFGDAGFCPI